MGAMDKGGKKHGRRIIHSLKIMSENGLDSSKRVEGSKSVETANRSCKMCRVDI